MSKHKELTYEEKMLKVLFNVFEDTIYDLIVELYDDDDIDIEDITDQMIKEGLDEMDMTILEKGLCIGNYYTTQYPSQKVMLECLAFEANQIAENGWWDGILDEDDFCDDLGYDNFEYQEISRVIDIVNEFDEDICKLLW